MPYDGVPVMAKPEMTTLLLPETEKPFAPLAPPLMVTPEFAVNVTPEAGLTELAVYAPAVTWTVSPETAFAAPRVSVQNGCAAFPGPVSEHDGFVLSTVYVVAADAGTAIRTVPAIAAPSTEPAMATRRTAALHRVTAPLRTKVLMVGQPPQKRAKIIST